MICGDVDTNMKAWLDLPLLNIFGDQIEQMTRQRHNHALRFSGGDKDIGPNRVAVRQRQRSKASAPEQVCV